MIGIKNPVYSPLVRLLTRTAKARFGQVGYQVSQVKDQVGQGQGQELDNSHLEPLYRSP